MKILALDFSTSQRSVAVVCCASGGQAASESEIIDAGGRTTRAISLIERALNEARVEREEIECIAIGLGPGSYTGIRASIALAQGWELARAVQLVGVGTVSVLAAVAKADGMRGSVRVVVDAQRGEFYCSTWEISDADCVLSEPLSIVSCAEVESRIRLGGVVVGPDLHDDFPEASEIYPSALHLGRLASTLKDFKRGEQLTPIYLRETGFVKAPPSRQIGRNQ